jgi:hypothetical protein
MRKFVAGLLALLLPCAANAQLVEATIEPAGDLNWSTTAGRTVGSGNSAFQIEAGWPGIDFTWLHGVDERTDWGFRASFNYGLEGTSTSVTGVNVAVPYRHTFGIIGDTSVAFQAAPGVSIYGHDGGAMAGIGGPIGIVCGFKLDPHFTFDIGADLPILISISNPAGVLFGPLFGIGAEYLLDKNIAVTARFRVGPEFAFDTDGHGSAPGFTALLGLAYNLR